MAGRHERSTSSAPMADGVRSRKAAGIDFPGWDATRSNLIAEVEVAEEPPPGMRQDECGVHGLALMADGRTYRVVTTEQQIGPSTEPTLAELRDALIGGLRNRFRRAQPELDLPLHRRHPAGRDVPQRARADRRRCRAHPLSRRRTGNRSRHPGRRQPGVEARPGRDGHLHPVAPGHLHRRTASRRGPSAPALDGADGLAALRRAD